MTPSSAGSLEGESGPDRLDWPLLVSVGVRVPASGRMNPGVTHTQAQWTNQTKARLITTRLPFISQLTVRVSWKSVWENSERL